MKVIAASLVTALLVASSIAASVDLSAQPKKRLFLDNVANVLHSVLDPVANVLTESVHTLVNEFDNLVHGRVNIQTVVCKLPTETGGTREEELKRCVNDCISNATSYLDEASGTSAQTCPIACAYALDHPTHYTC